MPAQANKREREAYDPRDAGSPDYALLKEVRENFDYDMDMWKDIRAAGCEDMRYVSGDPWPPAERAEREKNNRPCLVFDELSQYVNQLVNEIRQNKRSVKVLPAGNGASDDSAELRANKIRAIEYESRAQTAYCCAFENAANRSYGFWRILTEYESEKSFDQKIRIKRIPNPDTVLLDYDATEADFSDMNHAYILDQVQKKEFQRKWPDARITSFVGEYSKFAPNWVKDNTVQVAEYFRVEKAHKTLYLVKTDFGAKPMFEEDKGFNRNKVIDERESCVKTIKQYITNGLEILEENDWAGKYIPIIVVLGKELWIDRGAGSVRVIESFVRKARDPFLMYCYDRTTEAELIAMTPKTPWVGYTGQFKTHSGQWAAAHLKPIAYLQADPVVDPVTNQVLPLPERQPYSPEVQPLEIAAESARRAIMSAMGLTALPVNAQRLNDKSGVALKEIDANEDRGSFHFIDNFEIALEYSGRVINDLLDKIIDTPRDISIVKRDDTHAIVRVNEKYEHGTPEAAKLMSLDLKRGEHTVTISAGPDFESEREEAVQLLDTLLPNIEALPVDPTIKQKLIALAIKLKKVGPIGDQMAEILDPSQSEAQMQQQLSQLQQQLTQSQQQLALVIGENQKLYTEKHGKIVEGQFDIWKAAIDNMTRLAVAEIQTKAQNPDERKAAYMDLLKQIMSQTHDATLQFMEQEHEKEMADINAAHAAASQPQPGAAQ